MRWSTLARLAWEAAKPPDPKSLSQRAARAWWTDQEIGDAAELVNEVLKLSEKEEGKDDESC